MKADKTSKHYPVAWPLALCYGVGVRLRNICFDLGLLPSVSYPVAVISVGNLSAGGAGKTPLVEYLIRLLSDRYRVAVLSRGYRRKTKGYVLADASSTARDIGDEPSQMKRKYPTITVAVDADRRRGMRRLLSLPEAERPQVVLLDDAFQHRYVRPSLSLLATDSHRLFCHDHLLPVGTLREPRSGARRADMVVVNKCDPSMKPIESRIIEDELRIDNSRPCFFTCITYRGLEGVWPDRCSPRKLASLTPDTDVLLVAAIADPTPLVEEMRRHTSRVTPLTFPDHHAFTRTDIDKMRAALTKLSPDALVVCTEKDAARLRTNPLYPSDWQTRSYALPIAIDFLFGAAPRFDELILRHVETIEKSHILRREEPKTKN